jgi:hypothetical protein
MDALVAKSDKLPQTVELYRKCLARKSPGVERSGPPGTFDRAV